MADQERKDDAEEKDQDAEEGARPVSSRPNPDEASGDEAIDGGETKSASDDDDDADAAQRVAKALGVEDEEGEGAEAADKAADAQEPEVALNRAARRRDEALERRKKRKGGAQAKTEADEEPLPKDKNARAKELLKRRREQAQAPRQIQLLPGEMVDDALARSTSAAGKWIRDNFNKLQWVILAAVVGAAAFAIYTSQTEKKAAAATDDLFAGVSAELGRVSAEDKRQDEEKDFDPTKVFKTPEERADAALVGYRKAIAEHPGTIAAQLAKLGEAGALLEKRDFAGAIEAYSAVLASKLASTDADVKGRANEGLGLAKEGKGDLDGALAAFKEVEGLDIRGYKELGLYHQGRLLLAKGETEKAKDLLKQARDKLQATSPGAPGAGGPNAASSGLDYLKAEVDEALRRIDPSLVVTTPTVGGGKGMSSEDMEKIQKLLQDSAKKKPQEGQ